jgi:hypothetical protein
MDVVCGWRSRTGSGSAAVVLVVQQIDSSQMLVGAVPVMPHGTRGSRTRTIPRLNFSCEIYYSLVIIVLSSETYLSNPGVCRSMYKLLKLMVEERETE